MHACGLGSLVSGDHCSLVDSPVDKNKRLRFQGTTDGREILTPWEPGSLRPQEEEEGGAPAEMPLEGRGRANYGKRKADLALGLAVERRPSQRLWKMSWEALRDEGMPEARCSPSCASLDSAFRVPCPLGLSSQVPGAGWQLTPGGIHEPCD